jgi:hypothetical protein
MDAAGSVCRNLPGWSRKPRSRREVAEPFSGHRVVDRRLPIDADTRGKLRLWKARVSIAANEIEATTARLAKDSSIIKAFVHKRGKGRQRAAAKLRRIFRLAHLDGLRDHGDEPLILWSYLRLSGTIFAAPETPGEEQPCACIHYIMCGAGPDNTYGIATGMGTLDVTEHGLARCLQRCPGIDLTAAVFVGHRNLLKAPQNGWDSGREFLLRAGPGVFARDLVLGTLGEDRLHVNARAVTWLHSDQLHDDQITTALPEGVSGSRLGDGSLLPSPLRTICRKTLEVTPRPPAMPEIR